MEHTNGKLSRSGSDGLSCAYEVAGSYSLAKAHLDSAKALRANNGKDESRITFHEAQARAYINNAKREYANKTRGMGEGEVDVFRRQIRAFGASKGHVGKDLLFTVENLAEVHAVNDHFGKEKKRVTTYMNRPKDADIARVLKAGESSAGIRLDEVDDAKVSAEAADFASIFGGS